MKARPEAGGILWQRRGTDTMVALAADRNRLPHGEVRNGEHPIVRACAELAAFCGHLPVPGARIGRFARAVLYWEMRLPDGITPAERLRWLSPEEAAAGLNGADEGDRKAMRRFASTSRPDATVLLVRHGLAGSKDRWNGPDDLRPLDSTGRGQALQLRDALQYWRPERIISASKTRCTETVAPLAAAIGLGVEEEAIFTEECNEDGAPGAVRRLADFAGSGTTVICSQGGVIPETVSALHAAAGLAPPPMRAKKGSTWALQFAEERLIRADYYPDFAPLSA